MYRIINFGKNHVVITNANKRYVPCKRDCDGIIGIYDTLNKQFIIPVGNGEITYK